MKAFMIIQRYLSKEIGGTFLGVTFVMMLIFLSDRLVRYLSYAASGKVAAGILFQLIGFEIPYLLALLLPMGLYLGIMLAYSKLYADNEMRVLHACGVSIKQVMVITGVLAGVVTIAVFVLMFWINPFIAAEKEKLLSKSGGTGNIMEVLMPGRFQVMNAGRRVVFVEKVSRNRKHVDNIFIADQGQNKLTPEESATSHWNVLSANSGQQFIEPETKDRFMVATDGYRYEGTPGQNEYKIIQFKKYGVRAAAAAPIIKPHETQAIPTARLLENYSNPENAAEFQWRSAIPISVMLLALLAVPLSRVKPRQGRYGALFVAILIYVVYVNLLFVARNLVEQKMIPVSIGMWWVHILFLALFSLFMWMQFRIKTRRT